MFHDMTTTRRRLQMVRERIVRPHIWSPSVLLRAEMWSVPAWLDGTAGDPVPVEDALHADYSPVDVGTPWGAPWATTWFRFHGEVPADFDGRPLDAVLDIGFTFTGPGFQAEATIWEHDGQVGWHAVRGLHPMNHTYRLTDSAVTGQTFEVLVEAASNPVLVVNEPNPDGDVLTAGQDPIYTMGRCHMAVINSELYELDADLSCLAGWLNELPHDEPRANEIAAALDASMDALDPDDPIGSAPAARAALAQVLAAPASASAHRISAIGHAHIDSAWLWPLRETPRKCARTFSNVLALMEADPEFRFGCSQAVQYEWMRVHHPAIFEGIRDAVARGQWIPLGGSWVEADGNMPNGESHLRQLIHGQRFFREHFDTICTEIWIPDVFGYPASLPQLFRLGGAERFLTQKLSWNRTNAFPHHTFWWEGIDASRVYTHFPPVDTYNANFSPRELAHAVRNFRDHGRATRSLMPFGHGDGGGGPSQDMLDQYHRSKDFDGGPRITIESPAEFFDAAMAEDPDPPVWVGELYFEMHRGTYTSQARTKIGNRRAEVALREAELWSTTAFGGDPATGYPLADLDELWKTVLLHQFHDILPGSSIGWVHREAEETYADVLTRLDALIDRALQTITHDDSDDSDDDSDDDGADRDNDDDTDRRDGRTTVDRLMVANASPFARDEVVVLDGGTAVRTRVPALGVAAIDDTGPARVVGLGRTIDPITILTRTDDGDMVLENGILRITITPHGSIRSLVEISSGRESVAPGSTANVWQLHHDMPLEYDAWDIDEYYRNRVEELPEADTVTVDDDGPLVCGVRITRHFRSSSLTEVVELRAGSPRVDIHVELDWQERNRLLKVSWPLDISATEVTREIPYGHLTTAIHTNTSWDTARFEIPAQRWIHVTEGDFGFTLLNDGRHGHDVTRTRTPDGVPTTTMRLTVAKGAEYPDPDADMGAHRFTYSVMPFTAGGRRSALRKILSEAYALNTPLRVVSTRGTREGDIPAPTDTAPVRPIVSVVDRGAIVEVVKAAEDGSGDVILRVWEPYGNRSVTDLVMSTPVTDAWLTDALEDGLPPRPAPLIEVVTPRRLRLSLRPFQIATIRLRF